MRAPQGHDPVADPLPLLSVRALTKSFAGVKANDAVDIDVAAGEIHALLGENGAGKTTLISILYGLLQPDSGEILFEGAPVRIRSPRDAIARGIGLVAQHFHLARRHTVVENLALAAPGVPFFYPTRKLRARVRELGERYDMAIEPGAVIARLSPGERQRVEILKAMLRGARLLILDEPTSVLTPQEAEALFRVLDRMRAEGHGVIFISHKLDEVKRVADRLTVLRRGRVVARLAHSQLQGPEAEPRALAALMVGGELPKAAPGRRPSEGERPKRSQAGAGVLRPAGPAADLPAAARPVADLSAAARPAADPTAATLARAGLPPSDAPAADASPAADGSPAADASSAADGSPADTLPILKVDDLWVKGERGRLSLRGLSFAVRPGEILGVAGVAGNGQSALAQALTGLGNIVSGRVVLAGVDLARCGPRQAQAAGVAYVPEDRRHEGIVGSFTVAENLVLRQFWQRPFARGPLVDWGQVGRFADGAIAEFDVRAASPDTRAGTLSGGNVQKIVLARELSGAPRLVVASHPTYGLDVAATAQTHALLLERCRNGAAVVLISEDLPELMQLADRILVLFEGRGIGIVDAATARPESLGLLMSGHVAAEDAA